MRHSFNIKTIKIVDAKDKAEDMTYSATKFEESKSKPKANESASKEKGAIILHPL